MERGTRTRTQDSLPEGLGQAIRQTAGEIAALLAGATDTTGPVPGLEWTVGETAAHLALANGLMADIASGQARPYGDGTPQGLAAANAQSLVAFPERTAEPLAAMIVEQADRFLDAAGQSVADGTGTQMFLTPLGPMDHGTFASYVLTHMLGHGYDLARGLRRPHMIDASRVELCLPFLKTAMPRVSAASTLTARYTLRVRGGATFGVTFTDGTVEVLPHAPERSDCTIATEPVAFLLMALGRTGPWQAMARGAVLAWGRKPWLAPRFPTLFHAP
ncbi:maleylpyruvate isomerase family mycothiol-dependent enzyme [Streptomyces sp. Vc74B-19]|uniref:maleylpyruvate isomerase family mycothiol-dependent enzyme n=1 Tax=unclassified Streptomyces TaxID=2593676 RepID=UPI001BFC1694|nr:MULTISPECIES: maleylpyruvate isomerase family mycothiol-dependent enzyme [unclassified Streptomyces]MBT3166755.1 maleylpyruvate isomerase family mycothiol-dependent enzyme [Streptomyces sp. Vc74B-19]MCO4696509.1 maleylpyruvate isomerase family mycothiol-dependent enzyme [Streptomyces sp. RO-S4]MDU0302999.1 maleylpyruvate isomerase family mycothiol-dependent enzyme [Streptomyces sp. PAL114]